MHPELIKAHIRMRGTTPAAIADDLSVSRTAVAHTITGRIKSPRIRGYLCKLLGKGEVDLWPDHEEGHPGLRRASPSHRARGAEEVEFDKGARRAALATRAPKARVAA